MSDTFANPSETVNRYKKARKVADYLLANGVTEIMADNLNDFLKTQLASAADVNPPSAATWALIEFLLEEANA